MVARWIIQDLKSPRIVLKDGSFKAVTVYATLAGRLHVVLDQRKGSAKRVVSGDMVTLCATLVLLGIDLPPAELLEHLDKPLRSTKAPPRSVKAP